MDAPRWSCKDSPAMPCSASGPAQVASLVVAGATAALNCRSMVAFTCGVSRQRSAIMSALCVSPRLSPSVIR